MKTGILDRINGILRERKKNFNQKERVKLYVKNYGKDEMENFKIKKKVKEVTKR